MILPKDKQIKKLKINRPKDQWNKIEDAETQTTLCLTMNHIVFTRGRKIASNKQ